MSLSRSRQLPRVIKRRGRPCTPWSASAGFTLIELMIVVAIVAILAAIAYPAYTNAVIKGKRSEGRAALLGLLQQQERYFTQNNSYLSIPPNGTTATDASGASVAIPFQMTSGSNPTQAAYTLSAAACTGVSLNGCVTVVATPNFVDTITQLSIQSNGAKTCSVSGSTPTSTCWGGS